MTYWYYEGLKRVLAALRQATVVASVGATTEDDATYVDDVNPSLLQVGMTISSPQFPAGTTVLSVAGANVEMSNPATATADPANVTGVLPAGILEPVSLVACLDSIPQSPYNVFADLTPATFNGYAAKLLTPGPVQAVAGAGAALVYGCVTWTPTNYAVVNTISGVAWTIPGDPDPLLLASEIFEAPITLANPGQVLSMIPTLNLPFAAGWPFSPIV
jgi:hypothetical protein